MLSYSDISQTKVKIVKLLKKSGFNKFPNFSVKTMVPPSKKGVLGLYRVGSQFKGRLKIWVNIIEINRRYKKHEDAIRQLELTIAHELGHSIVDATEFYKDSEPFNVPDWYEVFDGDEELFVELFAMYLVEGDLEHAMFFDEFIPLLADEYDNTL